MIGQPKKILAAAGVAVAFCLSVAAPASAHTDHWKRHHHHYGYSHTSHYGYNAAPSGYRGADPSYGPGTQQFRQLQAQGRCVIDEGYGRYFSCGADL